MRPEGALAIIVLAATFKISKSVLVDKGKFEPIKPSPIDELPEERRLVNFKDNDEKYIDRNRSEKDVNINEEKTNSDKTKDGKQEKSKRTFSAGHSGADGAGPNCCGTRYDGSLDRPEAGHGGSLRGPSDNRRYPSRYGMRPEDRYGWHSYSPGSTGRRGTVASAAGSGSSAGGGGLYGSSQSGGDRHGTRPSHYDGESEYNRPSNGGSRPARPIYGYGYGDNGAYGSNGYEVSRPGGYGSVRPAGGINFGSTRPGTGTYGGGSYGGGTYGGGSYGGGPYGGAGSGGAGGGHGGVYGNIGDDVEFSGQDGEPGPEGSPSPGVNNLQTQKAVALKALAGVALIGAAAALATNPVLLPLGVLAGRKKRDVDDSSGIEDIDVEDLAKLVEDSVPEIYREKIKEEVLTTPTCLARLVCEVRREYIAERRNNNDDNKNSDDAYDGLKSRLVNMIQGKIFHADVRHKNIRRLVKSAAAYDGNCDVFVCEFPKG